MLIIASNVYERVNDRYQGNYYSVSTYIYPPSLVSSKRKVRRGEWWYGGWIGIRGENAVQVGQRLLQELGGLSGIHGASLEELSQITLLF